MPCLIHDLPWPRRCCKCPGIVPVTHANEGPGRALPAPPVGLPVSSRLAAGVEPGRRCGREPRILPATLVEASFCPSPVARCPAVARVLAWRWVCFTQHVACAPDVRPGSRRNFSPHGGALFRKEGIQEYGGRLCFYLHRGKRGCLRSMSPVLTNSKSRVCQRRTPFSTVSDGV